MLRRPSLPRKCKTTGSSAQRAATTPGNHGGRAPLPRESKATRSSGLSVARAPMSHGRHTRSARRGALPPGKKAQRPAAMAEQPPFSQPTTPNTASKAAGDAEEAGSETYTFYYFKPYVRTPHEQFCYLTAFYDTDFLELALGSWEEMHDWIVSAARTCFAGPVDWETLDAGTQGMLLTWTPKARAYMGTVSGARVMIEAWIWRVLVEHVFKGSGEQQHWKAYSEVLRTMECQFPRNPLAA
ncbi:hypothetical protein MFIFM68171_09042 [Madurella fahalii]|uniref:Uncharacterized protein n=1 Tax=Madurella fahalii TaxID=1157608 RepID=A0ABQ0GM53_9PEZI